MPKMDGLEFLERLMRFASDAGRHGVVFTEAGSDTTLRALELGRIDFIGKTFPMVEEHGNLCGRTCAKNSPLRQRRSFAAGDLPAACLLSCDATERDGPPGATK